MPTRVELNKENEVAVKAAAAKRGVAVSALVNKVLQDSGVGDKTVVPVVLQVPSDYVKTPEDGRLSGWLSGRLAGLLKALSERRAKK